MKSKRERKIYEMFRTPLKSRGYTGRSTKLNAKLHNSIEGNIRVEDLLKLCSYEMSNKIWDACNPIPAVMRHTIYVQVVWDKSDV